MKTLLAGSRLATAALVAVLAAATPAIALAQAKPAAAAPQASASSVVLDSAGRVLDTLDKRRAEFKASPAALNQFIKSEFNRSFDADYAARLVLGVHGRGAPGEALDVTRARMGRTTHATSASVGGGAERAAIVAIMQPRPAALWRRRRCDPGWP